MSNDGPLADLNAQGWLTTLQVADLFGVPQKYIHELALSRKGRPPALAAHRVGRLLLIRREVAERYQATHPRLGERINFPRYKDRRAAS